jgi:cell division transport system permease protein
MVKRNPGNEKSAATGNRTIGAVQSKTRISDRLGAWYAHHSDSAVDSLARMLRTPLHSLMTWLVVAIAVALPAALFIALMNLQQIGQQWQNSSEMSVFLQRDANETAVRELRERWQARPEIAQVIYISPTEALEEFRLHSGLGRVVDSLDNNPLPGVLLIQPANSASTPDALQALQSQLINEPLVAEVRIDMQWVKRLQQLIALAERIVMALTSLLALGLILIIGNTIRLSIENRREEILVVKLVGGTNAYIRRPLLYTGLWYGLGGGILAALLLAAGLQWLANPIAQLSALYQSNFHLVGLGFIGTLQLILLSGVTGIAGAWVAVGRHLSAIEPH